MAHFLVIMFVLLINFDNIFQLVNVYKVYVNCSKFEHGLRLCMHN